MHDGTDHRSQLLPMLWVLGAAQCIADSHEILGIYSAHGDALPQSDGEPAGDIAGTWRCEYVLVASDALGGGLFVDLRPGELHGCVRQWDKVEADDDYGRGPVAQNLTELIGRLVEALHTGQALAGFDMKPAVADGVLDWAMT